MKTSPNQAQSSGYSFAANTLHKDRSKEQAHQPKSTQDAFVHTLIAVVILGSLTTLMLKIIGVIIGGPDAVPGIVYLFSYGFILVFSVLFFFSLKNPGASKIKHKACNKDVFYGEDEMDIFDPGNMDPFAIGIRNDPSYHH